eukprot:1325353-Amorphochlora_amoeboformis.AAC.1
MSAVDDNSSPRDILDSGIFTLCRRRSRTWKIYLLLHASRKAGLGSPRPPGLLCPVRTGWHRLIQGGRRAASQRAVDPLIVEKSVCKMAM